MTLESLSLLEGKSYSNFINAIKSPATKEAYKISLRRYLNHRMITDVDDLLLNAASPKLIESQIIDYIMSLRNDGIAYATIQFLIAPILTYYSLNDVVLNKRKVSRYFGEYKRVVKDRAYNLEEIYKALQTADERMKVIILLLASTGQRIGSLSSLTLGNLTKNDNHGIYKIVVYESTNNEYYTYCSKECASAIDNYLYHRQRCGEKIAFNDNARRWEPASSPLIRQQFDVDGILQARHVKPAKTNAIRKVLSAHLTRCGLREVEHPTAPNSTNRCRKSVALGNGFRKFVITTFINSGLNHEIREMLVDHGTQLDLNYFRPSEESVLQEYLKAEPYLIIEPTNRLEQENQILKIDRTKLETRLDKLEELFDKFNLV